AGDTAFAAGDHAAAEKAYHAAEAKDRKDPAAIVGAMRAKIAKAGVTTDFNSAPKHPVLVSAVGELKRAIKLDDSYAPAHLELGRAYLVLGSTGEALESLRRAVELAPGDAEAHSALGIAHLAGGHLPDAIRELARSAEIAPGDA